MQEPKMFLMYYGLLSSEQGWGNVGLFLLCCVYLREVQQQDHACVCRRVRRVWMTGSVRGECQLEGLPGSSMVQTCFSWANKTSSSSGRNLSPNVSVTPNISISCRTDSSDPEGGTFAGLPFFNICSANKELLAGLKAKGSGLAVACWKMMCAPPRRRHHFRNFRFLHHPPPSEPSF